MRFIRADLNPWAKEGQVLPDGVLKAGVLEGREGFFVVGSVAPDPVVVPQIPPRTDPIPSPVSPVANVVVNRPVAIVAPKPPVLPEATRSIVAPLAKPISIQEIVPDRPLSAFPVNTDRLIQLDQDLNERLGGDGRETISARIGREIETGDAGLLTRGIGGVLDAIDPGHTARAAEGSVVTCEQRAFLTPKTLKYVLCPKMIDRARKLRSFCW